MGRPGQCPAPSTPGPGPCLHTGPTPLAEELGLSNPLQSWWTTGMHANLQAGLRGGRSPASLPPLSPPPQISWKLELYAALLGCGSCSMNWTGDEKCMGGHGHGHWMPSIYSLFTCFPPQFRQNGICSYKSKRGPGIKHTAFPSLFKGEPRAPPSQGPLSQLPMPSSLSSLSLVEYTSLKGDVSWWEEQDTSILPAKPDSGSRSIADCLALPVCLAHVRASVGWRWGGLM